MDNMSQTQGTAVQNAPLPERKLTTSRSLVKFILLSIVTCGIYTIVFYCMLGEEANKICTKSDGKKTMFALLAFLLGGVSFGIVPLVWIHRLCNRMGEEARRRNLGINFNANTFWIFCVLLAFTCVCPFIFFHKLIKTSNALNASYNQIG